MSEEKPNYKLKSIQTKRPKIETERGMKYMLAQLAEDSPEAIAILTMMYKREGLASVTTMLHMDDMNIRGVQLVYAFEEICQGSLTQLLNMIKARDPNLVKYINEKFHDEEVVEAGASFQHKGMKGITR